MIGVARSIIEEDRNIKSTFIHCLQVAGIDSTCALIPQVYSELSLKLFHARVNEYITASTEIQLQESGKAVTADQSLRDQLKTFSSLKKR